ncbi:AcrR family transcriptional regulator [Arthrobacter woluwensis]|uniref:TetR/AcrR family transcriptional regulator n=1 Tax=Arthrobacter woluwensis TaxID=156980 RepID=UPI0027814A4E|nr:TetR/AcrR family transcriptional regulator [Arthrobacter woluwensis]MDQ0707666.1 AcrR family transcriptional regulator [Arthrobacter woluwensis]
MRAKSRQRRQDLIAAASSVIAEHGIANASVRAVAERAEVSTGSVLYHFESFDQLVMEAVKGVIDEFSEQRRRLIDGVSDPVERLRLMIEAGIPEHISDELRIVYQVVSAAQDNPHFRRNLALVVERQVALYEIVLEVGTALGAFRPRMEIHAIAENLVALEDAYDLYLIDPDDWQRDRYLRNTLLFAELALDCTLITPGPSAPSVPSEPSTSPTSEEQQ